MNITKKYWNNAYRYLVLLIPITCILGGMTYTLGKFLNWYENVSWFWVLFFDFTQLIYLSISVYFIKRKQKVSAYNEKDIFCIKLFFTVALFIQYNLIIHLFPSYNTWSCSFIFMGIIAFLFDTKLMIIHISGYTVFLLYAHFLHWDKLLPNNPKMRGEHIVYCIIIYTITSMAFLIITHLVEKFLMQEQEQEAENLYLIEKQLEYYQNCDYMDKELRRFRHDIKGHFIGMEYLLKNNNYEELANYFQDLNQSFSFQEQFYHTGNLIVDSILNHDLQNKCSSHIKPHVSGIMADIHTVSSIDLCTLFSNMLSNAIKAANQCREAAELSIHFDCGSKFFSITIVNTSPKDSLIALPAKIKNKSTGTARNHGHGIQK